MAVSYLMILLPIALAGAHASAKNTQADSQATSDALNQAPAACSRTLLTNYDPDKGDVFGHDVSIWTIGDGSAVMFRSGMTIDADGAPNAYNSGNTGLDDLANAGEPGHWDGIVTDREGQPFIQGPKDPFPGFYVSQTALVDWSKERTDPGRYVDASKIPYIVLPGVLSRQLGAQLGDFAMVLNLRRGIAAGAIFADIGTLGEGSIALADELGVWSDARDGGTRGGILYVVFPRSGNRQPRALNEIKAETDKLFLRWGGMEKLGSCEAGLYPDHAQTAERNFH